MNVFSILLSLLSLDSYPDLSKNVLTILYFVIKGRLCLPHSLCNVDPPSLPTGNLLIYISFLDLFFLLVFISRIFG